MRIGNHVPLSLIVFIVILFVFGQTSCTEPEPQISFDGKWRAVLHSPGGDLPFHIYIAIHEYDAHEAIIFNGKERIKFPVSERSGNRIRLGFDHYDSFLIGEINRDGTEITGEWKRRAPDDGQTNMKFTLIKDIPDRFLELPSDNNRPRENSDFSGTWSVEFTDETGTSPAQAVLSQEDAIVTGTFLTPVGDYRFLEGVVEGNVLRLSCFDGAHAFLFQATQNEAGQVTGDFWSRDSYHASWTAERGEADLGDAYDLTKITNADNQFRFEFPDVDGNLLTNDDERFSGKAVIVQVFGTWCPNCNDETLFLRELYKQYHGRGLEIVGLANEFASDFEGRAEMVRRFTQRYNIPWPILIVGAADKAETSEKLADVDKITSYPTTIFINRSGKVHAIHTGFTGPGTGHLYDELKMDFHRLVTEILE